MVRFIGWLLLGPRAAMNLRLTAGGEIRPQHARGTTTTGAPAAG
jgi:hypothetical protein